MSEVNISVLVFCVQVLSSSAEWTDIAADFEGKWHFSNCIGAMDHVPVTWLSRHQTTMAHVFTNSSTFTALFCEL